MGYSENDGMVRIDRFKKSGKWYDTFSVDMSNYYNEPLIHVALSKAIKDRFTHDMFENGYFLIVCQEPYHINSHPIILWSLKE